MDGAVHPLPPPPLGDRLGFEGRGLRSRSQSPGIGRESRRYLGSVGWLTFHFLLEIYHPGKNSCQASPLSVPLSACKEHHPTIPNPQPQANPASGPLFLRAQEANPTPPHSLRKWGGLGRRAQLSPDTHTAATHWQPRGRYWHPGPPPRPAAGSHAHTPCSCPPPSHARDAPPSCSPAPRAACLRCRPFWPGWVTAGAWSPGSPWRPASPGQGQRPPQLPAGRKPRLSTRTSRPRRNPNR